MRVYAKLPIAVLAVALFDVAPAGVADPVSVTFFNRTAHDYRVWLIAPEKCVVQAIEAPFLIKAGGQYPYTMHIDTETCNAAQITWSISGTGTDTDVGGHLTYSRYKGMTGQWLTRMNFAPYPNAPRPYHEFLRTACGTTSSNCMRVGVRSKSGDATVAILPTAVLAQHAHKKAAR
ncbi:hypothetical protein ACL598_00965 [Bordetella bronchialis]|uniref:hypothetical protein n=1 Tax=Bordetella bronchialis TaxID=463025 RepID=UPI003D03A640